MRLPDACTGVIEWAYAGNQQIPCLRRVDADRMLCGRLLHSTGRPGFAAVLLQPADPLTACGPCVRRLRKLLGYCPVCGVELVGDDRGRAPEHDGCVGVNMPLRRRR